MVAFVEDLQGITKTEVNGVGTDIVALADVRAKPNSAGFIAQPAGLQGGGSLDTLDRDIAGCLGVQAQQAEGKKQKSR